MNKLRNLAIYACIGTALVLIASARIMGVDMTEGQILVNYWPRLIIAAGLLLGVSWSGFRR